MTVEKILKIFFDELEKWNFGDCSRSPTHEYVFSAKGAAFHICSLGQRPRKRMRTRSAALKATRGAIAPG